jgi:hypothetical protein
LTPGNNLRYKPGLPASGLRIAPGFFLCALSCLCV